MRVLVLTRYGSLGPSSRIRFYHYIPFLTDHGLDLKILPLLGNDYVRCLYAQEKQPVLPMVRAYFNRIGQCADTSEYDLVWLEKELLPWLPTWLESLLVRIKIPIVADYDDAIFHRYDLNQSPVVRSLMGQSIGRIMRRADTVVVGNEYLAEYARKFGVQRLATIPSVVNLDHYSPSEAKHDNFRIGWIGTPITAPFLAMIKDALVEVHEKTGADIVLIGAGEHNKLDVPGKQILPWSEETEVADLQSLDVGIMPLPDQPFERGKCGYKLIQYMACGLPAVASPVGMNTHIVEDGKTGFLASSHEDWVRVLMTLYTDGELRKRMGKAGRLKVEQAYNLQITAPKMLDILTKAASRKTGS